MSTVCCLLFNRFYFNMCFSFCLDSSEFKDRIVLINNNCLLLVMFLVLMAFPLIFRLVCMSWCVCFQSAVVLLSENICFISSRIPRYCCVSLFALLLPISVWPHAHQLLPYCRLVFWIILFLDVDLSIVLSFWLFVACSIPYRLLNVFLLAVSYIMHFWTLICLQFLYSAQVPMFKLWFWRVYWEQFSI